MAIPRCVKRTLSVLLIQAHLYVIMVLIPGIVERVSGFRSHYLVWYCFFPLLYVFSDQLLPLSDCLYQVLFNPSTPTQVKNSVKDDPNRPSSRATLCRCAAFEELEKVNKSLLDKYTIEKAKYEEKLQEFEVQINNYREVEEVCMSKLREGCGKEAGHVKERQEWEEEKCTFLKVNKTLLDKYTTEHAKYESKCQDYKNLSSQFNELQAEYEEKYVECEKGKKEHTEAFQKWQSENRILVEKESENEKQQENLEGEKCAFVMEQAKFEQDRARWQSRVGYTMALIINLVAEYNVILEEKKAEYEEHCTLLSKANIPILYLHPPEIYERLAEPVPQKMEQRRSV